MQEVANAANTEENLDYEAHEGLRKKLMKTLSIVGTKLTKIVKRERDKL